MFTKLQNQLRPYFTKAALKPIGQVLGSQVIFQLMSLVIGLLIVRKMPKSEYAIYTVLMSLQAMLAILSGSGIMIGFRKIGGRIWQDENALSALIKTASDLRIYITAVAFAIVGVYGGFLLYQQGLGALEIILFLVCILFIVIPEIFTAFICEALLLKKQVMTVQFMQLINQGLRLLLVLLLYLFFINQFHIYTILAITVLSIWSGYAYLLSKSKHLRIEGVKPVVEYRTTIISYIKKIWHNVMYFAFQSQIAIFLIGIFSTTNQLADFGALGRFSLIFVGFSSVVKNIVAPRFGRTQKKRKLKRQLKEIMVFLVIFSSTVFAAVFFFPNLWLMLLGDKYSGLSYELQLIVLLGVINLFMGTVNNINETKGWIKFQTVWEIPMNICSLILGLLIFDVTSLQGVIYLAILTAASTLSLFTLNTLYGLRKYQ